MNAFLRSHRVVDVEKHLVTSGASPVWSFCVTYLDNGLPSSASSQKPKVDYREILSEEEFARFCRLREIRKVAAKEEAVSHYVIFTDAELSEVARLETVTEAGLLKIRGIGKAKVEKYGKYFYDEAPQSPDPSDSGA